MWGAFSFRTNGPQGVGVLLGAIRCRCQQCSSSLPSTLESGAGGCKNACVPSTDSDPNTRGFCESVRCICAVKGLQVHRAGKRTWLCTQTSGDATQESGRSLEDARMLPTKHRWRGHAAMCHQASPRWVMQQQVSLPMCSSSGIIALRAHSNKIVSSSKNITK